MDLIIRNARTPFTDRLVDYAINDGIIVDIGEKLNYEADEELDVNGSFLSPGLVDSHAHLDKALIYDRYPPNKPRSTLVDMIAATRQLKSEMTAIDVQQRATEVIKMSLRNGTTAIRTYVEADPIVELRAVEGIMDAKWKAKDLIDLQTIAFAQEGWFSTPGTLELGCEEYIIEALKRGVDLVGGNVNAVVWPSDPEKQVDRMFEIAQMYNKDIDMHLDNADTDKAFTLPYVVKKTLEYGYQGRVAAGHVVGIAYVDEAIKQETIKNVKSAGVSIFVQPSRIKLTCVKDFVAAGANVAIGTDNMYDTFVYLGNANVVESMSLLARLLEVQTDSELIDIYNMGTYNGAKALKLKNYGINVGNKADIAIFNANSVFDLIRNNQKCLHVIKNGRIVVKDSSLV